MQLQRQSQSDPIIGIKVLTGKLELRARPFSPQPSTPGLHERPSKAYQQRKQCFVARVAPMWNRLPADIVAANSTMTFKRKFSENWVAYFPFYFVLHTSKLFVNIRFCIASVVIDNRHLAQLIPFRHSCCRHWWWNDGLRLANSSSFEVTGEPLNRSCSTATTISLKYSILASLKSSKCRNNFDKEC